MTPECASMLVAAVGLSWVDFTEHWNSQFEKINRFWEDLWQAPKRRSFGTLRKGSNDSELLRCCKDIHVVVILKFLKFRILFQLRTSSVLKHLALRLNLKNEFHSKVHSKFLSASLPHAKVMSAVWIELNGALFSRFQICHGWIGVK